MAERAADFAGQFVSDGFRGWIVPLQVVVAVDEVDVGFVEYSCPLKRCACDERVSTNFSSYYLISLPNSDRGWSKRTMLSLTSIAMAQFTIQRRIPA
jgi:hypothetical protein